MMEIKKKQNVFTAAQPGRTCYNKLLTIMNATLSHRDILGRYALKHEELQPLLCEECAGGTE